MKLGPPDLRQGLWSPAAPAPGQAAVPEPDGPNDTSVALLLRFGGLRLLLLGNLELSAQQAPLCSRAAARLAGVDVLKVVHHIFLDTPLLEGFRRQLQ
ncbi:hypothetical protein QFZ76_003716 [Streptomyces sp. V4I2]|nr:hypothetical protein [Streptomyces sp. V4I2]